MKLDFKPFDTFIRNYTTESSRKRYADSEIKEIEIEEDCVYAKVIGTSTYTVHVTFDTQKVLKASCTCAYDYGGYCKHIVHVLVYADKIIAPAKEGNLSPSAEETESTTITKSGKTFNLPEQHILTLSPALINNIAQALPKSNSWTQKMNIREAVLGVNQINGEIVKGVYDSYAIHIQQKENMLLLSCDCNNRTKKICSHLHFVLQETLTTKLLQIPFDTDARHRILTDEARKKGWYPIKDPDNFFTITLHQHRVYIEPKVKILPYTDADKNKLRKQLLPRFTLPAENAVQKKEFVVIIGSEYSSHLTFNLMEAPLTKSGEIKTPVDKANIQSKLRLAGSKEETLFYTSLAATNTSHAVIDDYLDIIKNPLNIDFYLYKESWSIGRITPKKLIPITLQPTATQVEIHVKQSDGFYTLHGQVNAGNKSIKPESINFYQDLFIASNTLYCMANDTESNVLKFFKQNGNPIFLQKHQFDSFKEEFLDHLENSIKVSYSFVKPAPKALIQEKAMHVVSNPCIYLSESEDFILITPAISYGDIEVAVLSKKTVYTYAPDGKMYSIDRNESAEYQFLRSIQAQHPSFNKLPQTEFYYLHRNEFLDNDWFIHAFDAWRTEGYNILGFNQLKNNRFNEHKIKVRTSVQSGIDWFDIHTDISFGKQKVNLKQIQKSIVNKSRFIELSDGIQGILPQEWLDKFDRYFRAGEIKDDNIRTHKSNFQLIDQLFEHEVLSHEAQDQIRHYQEKLANFHSITAVKIPKKLNATLRDYQKEGLNWLNFLDEFGFGGCLADDMGLGKTIQIIAFILTQHEKGNTQTNLIIVPTSLLFNWQHELRKFAPHLSYLIWYGNDRKNNTDKIKDYDIVITTYGTMLSDIEIIKRHTFNLLILDESQAIKNPDSKRHKAVRLLQGRQRIVLTGTPIENNTFDLYAQLSFALPGLLGNAKRFASDYSTPIDKFQDTRRAQELQQKIYPFVLRRTKKQVAKELPEKTEMIIYCEMGAAQRRVYDTYKLEFQKYLSGLSEDELHSSSLHILQGLTKLRQVCDSPALLSDEEYYGNESAKLDELLEQVRTLKDTHKILIFSQFVGMLELVKERLEQENIGHAYLTGKTRNREEQVALFQHDPNTRVFLISLKAGGTGLNLTQAEYVFLLDPWWNPAVENQAIDRAYRIGQQNKVIAVRFITPGSIEEKIMELQSRKRQLAEDLIHTDNNILKQLKKKDLMNLV